MNRTRTLVIAALAVVVLAGCAQRVHPHASLPDLRLGEPSFFPRSRPSPRRRLLPAIA
jgi:hypothetical protein